MPKDSESISGDAEDPAYEAFLKPVAGGAAAFTPRARRKHSRDAHRARGGGTPAGAANGGAPGATMPAAPATTSADRRARPYKRRSTASFLHGSVTTAYQSKHPLSTAVFRSSPTTIAEEEQQPQQPTPQQQQSAAETLLNQLRVLDWG